MACKAKAPAWTPSRRTALYCAERAHLVQHAQHDEALGLQLGLVRVHLQRRADVPQRQVCQLRLRGNRAVALDF